MKQEIIKLIRIANLCFVTVLMFVVLLFGFGLEACALALADTSEPMPARATISGDASAVDLAAATAAAAIVVCSARQQTVRMLFSRLLALSHRV